jgi:lipoprotein signal peptidase
MLLSFRSLPNNGAGFGIHGSYMKVIIAITFMPIAISFHALPMIIGLKRWNSRNGSIVKLHRSYALYLEYSTGSSDVE